MTARILLIDDEHHIRKMLQIALGSVGYEVAAADSVASGLTQLVRFQPQLVILDLGLPDGDGLQYLQEIRSFSAVPVLVLSVRSSDRDKVQALDAGAQDYVSKPFSVEELLARVRALLRDHRVSQAVPALTDGQLRIELALRQVWLAEQRVELTPKEYAVLAMLAQQPNKVVLQKQLLAQIWGPSHSDDSHYLRIVVSHLRQKLGDDPLAPRYLRTEPGVGYRLCL